MKPELFQTDKLGFARGAYIATKQDSETSAHQANSIDTNEIIANVVEVAEAEDGDGCIVGVDELMNPGSYAKANLLA